MAALKMTSERKIENYTNAIIEAELSFDAKKKNAIPMLKSNIETEKKLFDYRELTIKEKMKSRTELKDVCLGILKII